MSIINNFKQAEEANVILGLTIIATGAAVGVGLMALSMNKMSRRLDELEKLSNLNAAVTLNLTNAVGQLTGVRSEIQ